jgi:hypothetical protein
MQVAELIRGKSSKGVADDILKLKVYDDISEAFVFSTDQISFHNFHARRQYDVECLNFRFLTVQRFHLIGVRSELLLSAL